MKSRMEIEAEHEARHGGKTYDWCPICQDELNASSFNRKEKTGKVSKRNKKTGLNEKEEVKMALVPTTTEKKSKAKKDKRKASKKEFEVRTFCLGNSGKTCTVYSEDAFKKKFKGVELDIKMSVETSEYKFKHVMINSRHLYYVTSLNKKG